MPQPQGTREIVESYDSRAPLQEAWTIPASWYVDPRIADLERRTTFSRNWQMVGRAEEVAEAGQFLTTRVADEPVLVVRGQDGVLRGFFNVCRHHAAAVETREGGKTHLFRCPYHGWTYNLAGELKGTPDFGGVCEFDKEKNGLVPIAAGVWEKFVFVRLDPEGSELSEFVAELAPQFPPLDLASLHFQERRIYEFDCNWKVFVDNYLDGGYHIPHIHKGLDSVLDYSAYTIETGARHCLQASPVVSKGAERETGAVRKGQRALYYWIHPNFMVNWYEGVMDTNLVIPLGGSRTQVIFDFYFPNVSETSREQNLASISVGQRIQDEDVAICKSVHQGLTSRAYVAGRLSVRREAGEHLFHRLLAADLRAGLDAAG